MVLDAIAIVVLIVCSFILGMVVSDHYHEKIETHLEYALRITQMRIGYQYVQPPRRRYRTVVSDSFAERLRTNGRATEMIKR